MLYEVITRGRYAHSCRAIARGRRNVYRKREGAPVTKREKILLSSLALVAAAVVFFFYSAMARDRITAARAAIARYRKAEAAIPSGQGDRETLEQEIAELKGATTAASAQADSYNFV